MNARLLIAFALFGLMLGLSSGGGTSDAATPSGADALHVTAGWGHSCLVEPDGSAKCWGQEVQGQTEIPEGPFQTVVGGAYQTCAILMTGAPICWGSNQWMEATIPPSVSSNVIDISADYYHTCVVDSNHTATCWGLNPYGETNVPAGEEYTQISIGSSHTCGLKENGAADCWGLNDVGQADDKPGPFSEVSSGNQFTCGLKVNQELECWGRDTFGESTPPGGTFIDVDAGGTGSCAITTEGELACWGGSVGGENTPPVEPGQTYVEVSRAGQYHACAVRTDQSIVCWGSSYPAPVPNIRPDTLPDGNAGTPYDATLEGPPSPDGDEFGAGLAPYTFQVWEGALPNGLSLDANGDVSGTPTTEGSSTFTVRMDDARHFTAYKEYTIEIGESTGPALIWGNSDCDVEISTRDNQALLRTVLQQPALSQTEPCPDLGAALPTSGPPLTWGDWDCDGEVSTRDNQALLRKVLLQAALSQTEPCPDLGDTLLG